MFFSFICTGTAFAFFSIVRKNPFLKHLLNNKESGYFIEDPQSFTILINIPSCTWALLKFKSWINFSIFFESTVFSLLELSKIWIDGRVLLFGIVWHCLLKKSLKIFVLSLKFVTGLFLTNMWGITGAFLRLTKV